MPNLRRLLTDQWIMTKRIQFHEAEEAKSTTCQQSSCEDGFACVYVASDFTYPQPGSTGVRKHKEKEVVKYKH